ncbi:GTP cyclohydrolase II RibA [Rhizobium sp. SSA_523]|uniref:GTP cyclohydrolase II RibA n=1 Tax=Rhizobium sp. SSA_523 TaxID=2952477 RepID=UPI002090CC5B|nr:GTP cyclohydrolase II RibA [Rhizobium sp. SSA_523]MCO5732481.1 GTP cyclohydrolase II RibA [Rhizobium sp. SSA_523]WKC22378.1 GTP cyclohydrolase II RibA [Rhizobium sp. SSA_523]
MTGESPFSINGTDPAVEVERTVSELRYGRPIILHDNQNKMALVALDAVQPRLFDQFAEAARQNHGLLLTRPRAARIGIKTTTDVLVPLAGKGFDWASRLSYAVDVDRPETWTAAPALASAAVDLTQTALLLPALVCADVSEDSSAFSGCCSLHADRIAGARPARESFQQIVRTRVPLNDYGDADFVVFRGGLAQKDQVAIIVGKPDVSKPVPIRIHSSCITGDLCGSLKCDCGDQLRNGLDLLLQAGGGVLLYLDQEGRGTGIGAKMRAYGYQHRGLDTIDADAELGFAPDHRRYESAIAMLKLLSISQVVVYTNNPTKIESLRRAGITVHARTPVLGRVTSENENYLRTKTLRAGHMLDLETLIAAE